jgi:dTDP-4-amino-4,6-dideoxygalactose transaminase
VRDPAPSLLGRTVAVGRPNLASSREILQAVGEVLGSRQLTNNGPLVQRLESVIADETGLDCVLTSSGTTAMELMLRMLPPGEVIVPSFTFVATAHAVMAAGHRVVFADIDRRSHCLSVEAVASAMSEETVAILPVHLWGNPADPSEFEALGVGAGVPLFFDAAHAFLTTHQGVPVGQFGTASAFSLHATKAFSAVEGGCIMTRDADLAQRLRMMRTFGMDAGGRVLSWGSNNRMSELHAAVGLANYELLDDLASRNMQNFAAYQAYFESSGVGRLIEPTSGNRLVSYVILELLPPYTAKRELVVSSLARRGVILKEYFAPPCHLMPPYVESSAGLPVTEEVSRLTLALPTGLQLNPDDCALIAEEIVGIVRSGDFNESAADVSAL